MKNYCFGIDVGGTTVKCGFFKTDGTLLDKWEIVTNISCGGERILPDVAEAVLAKLEEKGVSKDDVAGIGIGVPGPVKEDGTLEGAVNLHWGYHDIVNEMGELTGLPTKAGNDANVAALGEMWKGGGSGHPNVMMVTLGTGVGGGMIVNGKIITGAHGAAGEIGHAHVEDNITDPCNCGNRGCLEQVASATGIVRLAKEELEKNDQPTILSLQDLSAKTVFDAYKEQDAVAEKIVNRFAGYLGTALAVFSAVVDPDVIVIGGGVSKAGEVLVDCVGKYFRQNAFSACKNVPIVLAKLGNDAGIYGAAKMVLD
ncbi:MAG: ROK family glucokinase [Lachnospiraceae bacterium]|nr:ROK family glucokinase [Lachnospiraceae bacterium]